MHFPFTFNNNMTPHEYEVIVQAHFNECNFKCKITSRLNLTLINQCLINCTSTHHCLRKTCT